MAVPLRIVKTTAETGHSSAEGARDFEAFFEDEYPHLFGALCLVTRNRYEAEEIAQDAFLKVWERWDRVSEMESPAGYLYRTAMNAFRKRYRRALLALRSTLRITPADDGIEAVEARDATVRALAPLSDRQRAAVVLMDLLGYPSEEAARMLGVSASTVRNHASRAHAALKKTMGEDR
ncbi:MAG: RNA polymerase sigma factor [Solirubrobacterales bacterium]